MQHPVGGIKKDHEKTSILNFALNRGFNFWQGKLEKAKELLQAG